MRTSRPAVVIPGAPLLVPELVGTPGDREADRVRAAVLEAGRWLADRADTWHVIAGGPLPVPTGAGTFAGFGADVLVTAAPGGPSGEPGPDPHWPLPLLVAAWLRGMTAPSARLTGFDDAAGLLFVLDGPNTLTPRAPGGHRPQDEQVFAGQVAAVCEGSPDGLDGLDSAWRAAAEAMGGRGEMLYRGAPFGVGYLVATGVPR
ncbi:hypothetical protein GCM10027289_01670 [Tsukamurella serpentis]